MFEEAIGNVLDEMNTESKINKLKDLEAKRQAARLELEKYTRDTPHYRDLERHISNLTKKIKKARKELGSDL